MEGEQEHIDPPAAVARSFLLHAGSIMIGCGISAAGLLSTPGEKPPSTFHGGELSYQVHIFVLYSMGLLGSALLYLSFSIQKFPTAARQTAVMAAAVRRRRQQLIRWVSTSHGDGTSLSGFYCCVWFAAAAVYVVPSGSICFRGLMWLDAVFSM